MKTLRILVCAALLAPGLDHAADRETIAEEFAFQLVHLADTGQTLDIAAHPDRYGESRSCLDAGWAIGRHPSRAAVWTYMSTEAALHAGVTLAMVHFGAPRWVVRTWEAVTIAVDADTVANNASVGLRVRL